MKYLKAAFASAMFGCVASAFAGAGVITTTVTALQDNVTYSKPATTKPVAPALTTYIGYTVLIKNEGGNTINNIRFNGKTSVTDSAENAVFSSAEGASCTPALGMPEEINCSIGQLTAGLDKTFTVFFLAPEDKQPIGVKNVVKFEGSTFYAEGTGGINSVPDNSIKEWICSPSPAPEAMPPPPCEVELGTFNPERIKSSAPKAGVTLSTGNDGVTTQADRFSTRVVIPPGVAYTTAEIFESQVPDRPCTNFIVCDQTSLTIPPPAGTTQFTPFLTIVLRADASNILKGTKIDSVLLYYQADSGSILVEIPLCATGPQPDSRGIPCIADRQVYKRNVVPSDLAGDFEWTLISLKNGRITTAR